MITQEQIDKAVDGIASLTGQDQPDAVFVVMDFDGFVATISADDGGEESADIRLAKKLLSTMEDQDLMQVRNEAQHLLEETERN